MSSTQESGQTTPDPPSPTPPSTSSPGDIPVAAAEPTTPTLPSIPTVITIVAWVVTGGLALLALGRLVHLDDAIDWPYTVVNALTPLLYLPAYAAVAVAFARRRNLLLIVSVALIAVHAFWTVPELLPGHAENAASGSARIRVMSANLRYDNAHADRLGAQIQSANPDVLVLLELTPLTLAKVASTGALRPYTYHEVRATKGAFGAGIYSRFPLRDAAAPTVGDGMSLRATVQVDENRRFVMYAVHTISPTSSTYTTRWRTQLTELRHEARTATLPVIMAGDFNATRDHRPFRQLVDAGVRDAHDVVGGGWEPTWSATAVIVPPVLRIDHVLASPAFAVTGFSVGREYGSDHLPIFADLAMR
ncbi:endonuclease/exonuclease/phosphatase family protein [Frankia sp. Ag45/Mut15]|uniref:Endonuclease/exonuclease/phosphatase family protein n=1 Tax=Frankia umida TaxID=573489 RepID=A0ABT0K4Q4_9ACTN|nr:endonuclease/exonuclease/phosphatase family protein [Frankia umida]MCK9878776.1 endonuclease/exonuclease/phosphatase family protein [Frankia umida]